MSDAGWWWFGGVAGIVFCLCRCHVGFLQHFSFEAAINGACARAFRLFWSTAQMPLMMLPGEGSDRRERCDTFRSRRGSQSERPRCRTCWRGRTVVFIQHELGACQNNTIIKAHEAYLPIQKLDVSIPIRSRSIWWRILQLSRTRCVNSKSRPWSNWMRSLILFSCRTRRRFAMPACCSACL